MTWGRPDVLYALWGLPVLAALLGWALHSRRRAVERLGPMIGQFVSEHSQDLHRVRAGLVVAAAGLLIVALAQPRWGFRWQELRREGLSLVVVLDVSLSMDAQDTPPSRMERAQREALDLSLLLTGDRVGLVLAADGSYPRLPLTLDYDAFRQIVRDSDTSSLKAKGSDLGAAIDVAAQLLGPEGEADRAMIIISDGEDHIGKAVEAAERVAADGIHIYTLGVGTAEGAPIPMAEGGFVKDGGEVVLSRADEALMKELARAGSGAYARSVAGNTDVRALYEDEIKGKLALAEQGARREKVFDERYQWPLGLAFGLLVLGGLLGPGRLRAARGTAATVALALLLAAPPTRADDAPNPELQRLLAEHTEHPADLSVAERAGEALFRAGDYARAEEILQDVADRSIDPSQSTRARYNAGLAAYRDGRQTEALEAWQQVLESEPEHAAAKQNAEAVSREIQKRLGMDEEQQQQQQQDGDQGDTGQQDDPQQSQDQQSQDQQSQQDQQDQQDQQSQDPQDQDQQASDGTREDRRDGDTGQEQAGQRGEIEDKEGDSDQQAQAGDTGLGDVERPGSLSEAEAGRMLDGVEEGEPRVVIQPGSRGGKGW